MKSNLPRKSFALVATAAMLVASFFVVQHARGESAKPSAPEVKIDNFTFTVPSVTVAAGTEVTWVNRDDIPHTVVSQEGVFKSKALDTDDKFSFKFSQPGTYHYFCSIHPKMTAEVVVK
ncbi:MAG: amicyanin [Acidobacteria bacterium]|nr:MAG: amicyanin [Acidobacteriota bacterium]